jgi:hypothetical protein
MHTLKDLEAIRNLEIVVGTRETQEANYGRHQRGRGNQQQSQIAIARIIYYLKTR